MKNLRMIKWSLFALCFVVYGQNCGQGAFQSQSAGEGQNKSVLTAGKVPFQMLNKKQILSSFVTVAGLENADEGLVNRYREASTVLSVHSDMNEINPPRMVSMVNIAGETCRQVMDQERTEQSKRLIRYGLPKNHEEISSTEIDHTIRALARSFWSRNETDDERAFIKQTLNEFSSVSLAAGRNPEEQTEVMTLFLCTSMLSSLDAVTF